MIPTNGISLPNITISFFNVTVTTHKGYVEDPIPLIIFEVGVVAFIIIWYLLFIKRWK